MALGKRNQKSNMSSHLQINGPKNMLESIDICTQVVHSEFIILQSKKKDLIWTAFIITSAHRCPMKMSPGRRLLYSAVRHQNNKMKSASAFWWHQVLGTVELASSWLFILFFFTNNNQLPNARYIPEWLKWSRRSDCSCSGYASEGADCHHSKCRCHPWIVERWDLVIWTWSSIH